MTPELEARKKSGWWQSITDATDTQQILKDIPEHQMDEADHSARCTALDHAVRLAQSEDSYSDTISRAQTFYEFLTRTAPVPKMRKKK